MRYNYRIVERATVRTNQGISTQSVEYVPQYRENTFLGRICGWVNIVEYPCSSEKEAEQKITNHKLRQHVYKIKNKIKYIDNE